MTLPQDVQDAVGVLDNACLNGRVIPSEDAWQTIRAYLLSQETDIARLRTIVAECANEAGAVVSPSCSWQFLADVPYEIRMVCRNAESRLAAADALLRELLEAKWCTPEYDEAIKRVISHLQGSADEA